MTELEAKTALWYARRVSLDTLPTIDEFRASMGLATIEDALPVYADMKDRGLIREVGGIE